MIDPQATTTYAQYNEDIILKALLYDVKKGFYVDAGANYPTIDSVTKLFYEAGWRGINIEPIARLCKQLKKERPGDITLQVGLGSKSGKAVFREFKEAHGHSTFSAHEQQLQKNEEHTDYQVEIKTLEQIVKKYAKDQNIHFLKIDVEGYEYEVISGNDWANFRPEVLCIEATRIDRNWKPLLVENSYKEFINDGINTYYIAEESWWRTEGFAERVVMLDYHALKQHQQQSWDEDSKRLVKLTKIVEEQDALIKHLQRELAITSRLSMYGKPLRERLGVGIKGFTKDYIIYKRGSNR